MMDLTIRLSIRPNGKHSSIPMKALFGVMSFALMIFLVLTLAVVSKTPIVGFDQDVANSLNASASSSTISIFKVITSLGHYGVMVLGAGLAAFFAIRQDWRRLVVWCGAIGGGQVLNFALKTLIARSRPVFEHPVVIDDGYGFPSGHSLLSVVTYGLLAYLLYQVLQRRWQKISLVTLTTIIVGLIGLSRLVLGVHFTTDVLAGFTIGIVWLSASVVALQILDQLTVERRLQLSVQRTPVTE